MIAMKSSALFLKLKHLLKRASSLLMLFQRTPAAQLLVPAELNLAGSIAAMQPAQFAIATVVGLGAFDGIAGATTLSQISPTSGSTTVPIIAGTELTGANAVTFFVNGSPSQPKSWTVSSGMLPAGLSLPDVPGDTNSLTGTTTQTGSRSVTIRAWRFANASGDYVQRTFNFVVTAPGAPVITTQPQSITINSGQTTTLSVTATGGAPLTYQWYQGTSGQTATLVGTNSPTFTTPQLATTTKYWVKITNAANIIGVNSNTATVTATFTRPVLDPITFPVVTVGTSFSHTITAQNYPRTFTITGLPKGLRAGLNGAITGMPDVSGVFNVQIRATNSAGSSALTTARLTVKALPRNYVGSFGGIISRHNISNRNLGGQFSLTVTSSGVYTLRIIGPLPNTPLALGASASTSATGRLAASAPHITTTLAGAAVSLTLDSASGDVSGTVGLATVNGWRAVWNASMNPAEHLAGYYSMALDLSNPLDEGVVSIPQGSGYATLTVSQGGTLTLAGKTADGESITTSGFLSDSGDFWVFSSLYKNAGILHGSLVVTADTQGEFAGNAISGELAWLKPLTVSRTYASSFGPVTLAAVGGYLAPASTGNVILGLPDAGTVGLRFTDGGLANSTADPDVNVTYTDDNKLVLPAVVANPSKVMLTLNANTGAMVGNFTLVESGTLFTRARVPFQGQVVRFPGGEIKAVGYFLLPQLPTGAQKPSDTVILSGGVQLWQPTP
jgi:hypothetical protein